MVAADVPQIHPETRTDWRRWLVENGETASGVWLVTWRKAAGRPAISYEESVLEALCFGWVDSTPRKLDDQRTMLYFAPRKAQSGWSRPNKRRVAELRAAGLMTEAGERVIAQAEANGGWTLLDEVEDLIEPADLRAAFDASPPAWEQWRSFPPSARRGILEWIVQARTAATRAKRVAETAARAAVGERANQWRPKE